MARLRKSTAILDTRTPTNNVATNLGYEVFAREFVNCGFNQTKAYQACVDKGIYAGTDACSNGHSMVRMPAVWKKINEVMEETGLKDLISDEFIYSNLVKLFDESEHTSEKIKIMEMLAKIKGLLKPTSTNINVAVFDSNNLASSMYSKRQNDIENMKKCN